MAAEFQAPRGGMHGCGADKPRETLRKFPGVPIGICAAQMLTCDEAKHAVAEEFQAFVILAAGFDAMGTVGERTLETLRPLEMAADNDLELPTLRFGHNSFVRAISSLTAWALRPAYWLRLSWPY